MVHDSIYAERDMCCVTCPSVCLSVTGVNQSPAELLFVRSENVHPVTLIVDD